MRVQLALNVDDLDAAVDYYRRLFGAEPHKQRPGYANFALDTPPLKLVLFEKPGAGERINHLGVEVSEPAELDAAIERLSAEGLAAKREEQVTCCHATQDKIWSVEPQGIKWEWYRVTDDDPNGEDRVGRETAGDEPKRTRRQSSCCAGA